MVTLGTGVILGGDDDYGEEQHRSHEARAVESREPYYPNTGDIDKQRRALILEALSNENRLSIIEQLRSPKTVSEIILPPTHHRAGENPDRPISRQAVRVHLARLAEIGILRTTKRRRGDVAVEEHALDRPGLFAVLEDLRSLVTDVTDPQAPVGIDRRGMARVESQAPRLVLVRGLGEGRVFPLRPAGTPEADAWIIGRQPGVAVELEYDPHVSRKNSAICPRGHDLDIRDLSSSNGTHVNGKPLFAAEGHALRHGDIIGVGRSILVFHQR